MPAGFPTRFARTPKRPFHPGLVSCGACLLIATFVTDGLYWKTLLFQWNNFSSWLLSAGLALAALAAFAFVLDLILGRVRAVAWPRFIGLTAAVVLSVLNVLVHSRDSYTAVVPEGITLSAIVALLLIVVGIGGWNLSRVSDSEMPARWEAWP